MRRPLAVFLCTVAIAIAAQPAAQAAAPIAMRWGPMGHRIVGRIAATRLTPEAAREVSRLLDGGTLASVANWADSFRVTHPETGPWHYVDIPTWESSYNPERDCKDGKCVIAALTSQIAILGDKRRPRDERAQALRFVVHFVGDMHQPLHAGERGDKGGNDVKLTFNGNPGNLHSVWDSGLLNATGESEDALVASITARLAQRGDIRWIERGSIVDWAMESHDVARDVVYRFVPPSLVLGPEYLREVRPVLEDQLLRGGVRLAAVLNRTLDD
ncbi:MAG: S1/P1 nuclease [Gemmatimonadota bacterium]